jgi:hypothetical protein
MKTEMKANARRTTLRRKGEQIVGIVGLAERLMMQNGDFGDGKDKTNQTNNQKPKAPFDRQNHPCDQNGRHDPINNNRQKYIHRAQRLPKAPRHASAEVERFTASWRCIPPV